MQCKLLLSKLLEVDRIDGVQRLNPFLSEDAIATLISGAQSWQQLCVLEDKLQRCLLCCPGTHVGDADACHDRSALRLAEDLANHSGALWNCAEHPEWLAWQVLERLEIRERQIAVALKLLDNNRAMKGNADILGAILQLNMGEGKTRVILPMLALELCGKGEVVRLNFLSQLLPEAVEYLHACLTGVYCVPVVMHGLVAEPSDN